MRSDFIQKLIYQQLNPSVKRLLLIATVTLSAFLTLSSASYAQNTETAVQLDELKGVFILKFFQYLYWPEDQAKAFHIGILGDESTLTSNIQRAAKTIVVRNRKFVVHQYNHPKLIEPKKIHMLYIGKEYLDRLPEIARSVRKTNTVLVTFESQTRRDVMLNLKVLDSSRMSFEVNRSNLIYEGIKLDNEILLLGGSELDVAELFRELEDSLFLAKTELDSRTESLKNIEKEFESKQLVFQEKLNDQTVLIKEREKSVNQAQEKIKSAQKKLINTQQDLNKNQQLLEKQTSLLDKREQVIDDLSNEIDKNSEILQNQRQELGQKSEIIGKQRLFLIVIVGIALIFMLFLIIIIKVNRSRNLAIQQLQIEKEKTLQLNEELQSFSYAVSHDLRAPLRALDGFGDALLEDYGDKLDDTGKQYIHYLKQSSAEMSELVDGLLVLSRCTRGGINIDNIDLSEISSAVVQELENAHPNDRVEIKIQKTLKSRGDPILLRNVLTNLIGNAWKYSSKSKKPKIQVGKKNEPTRTVYFVKDNGVGFNMSHKDRLFQPFQRLHKQQEFEGNGIGLATVKKIIERHGGRVWAEGIQGKGSTFYFTLGEEVIA